MPHANSTEGTAELRILTPIGMLGYGYDNSLFWSAVQDGLDAIICDSGSTDGGPSKLAFGKTTCPPPAYRRDLEPMVEASNTYRIPILIGSAGGDGANSHVDLLASIISDIIKDRGFRTMKIVKIYSEIDKSVVRQEHEAKRIHPCGSSVPPLESQDIEEAACIVAQMGHGPYLEAMNECTDFDIIIGGRSYDPAPYAAFCVYRGFKDLGLAYHMGKVMECGAVSAVPKSAELLAIIRHDSFDVVPLNVSARCTGASVAAHSLYEKTRPDVLLGPGGALNLEHCEYEELLDERTVRVRGARFHPSDQDKYTIKLEAARRVGYQSLFFGGITDPILIGQIDQLLPRVKAYVESKCNFPHDLKLTCYGHGSNVNMFSTATVEAGIPNSVAICGQSRATTQEQANQVVNTARIACIHASYPGQRASAGNFAMLYSSDIPLGEACEFCMYHLMIVEDPISVFPRHQQIIQGTGDVSCSKLRITQRDNFEGASDNNPRKLKSQLELIDEPKLSPPAKHGFCYLGEFASVVRSKNAGPYEITFDIMFDSDVRYNHIKASGVLSKSVVKTLYNIEEEDIIAALWWDVGRAYKFTVRRPIPSGGFGDVDIHASCQHTPLMYLQLPSMPPDSH